MIRYILLGILSILFHINGYSDTYGVMTGNIGNVYYSGLAAGETQYQNQAIAYLCNSYLKKHFPSIKEKVFLELGFGDMTNCKLSFDKFQRDGLNNEEDDRLAKGFGIRIKLSQNINRAESVLKLLDYGLSNLSELKESSNNYFKKAYYDRPRYLTVDSVLLSKVLKTPTNEKIKNILSSKVFRNLGTEKYEVYKEYFFKNDKYYFVDFFNRDSVYLELNQVYQIITEYYLGTLIFETDSTGYFYSRENKKLSSKFKINAKKPEFYITHTSSDNNKKRIYFEYDVNKEGKKKFIYLTDKLILIQNVNEYEDEMIKKEIEKCTKG